MPSCAGPQADGVLGGVPPDLDTTRAYISGSLWSGCGSGDGAFSDGPYGIQEPAAFFAPGFYPYAFNPEAGSPPSSFVQVPCTLWSSLPPAASLCGSAMVVPW